MQWSAHSFDFPFVVKNHIFMRSMCIFPILVSMIKIPITECFQVIIFSVLFFHRSAGRLNFSKNSISTDFSDIYIQYCTEQPLESLQQSDTVDLWNWFWESFVWVQLLNWNRDTSKIAEVLWKTVFVRFSNSYFSDTDFFPRNLDWHLVVSKRSWRHKHERVWSFDLKHL